MNRVVDSIYESEFEEETWVDFVTSAAIWLGIAGVIVTLLFARKVIIANKNARNTKKA